MLSILVELVYLCPKWSIKVLWFILAPASRALKNVFSLKSVSNFLDDTPLCWTVMMSESRIHFARRWSQGLLFHQAIVDCARAAILMPLGTSILHCKPVNKCSLVETAFLLLVTVSTVNLLTTVLNDAPVLPDDDDDDALPMLMDSPQCVIFGMFMIW